MSDETKNWCEVRVVGKTHILDYNKAIVGTLATDPTHHFLLVCLLDHSNRNMPECWRWLSLRHGQLTDMFNRYKDARAAVDDAFDMLRPAELVDLRNVAITLTTI